MSTLHSLVSMFPAQLRNPPPTAPPTTSTEPIIETLTDVPVIRPGFEQQQVTSSSLDTGTLGGIIAGACLVAVIVVAGIAAACHIRGKKKKAAATTVRSTPWWKTWRAMSSTEVPATALRTSAWSTPFTLWMARWRRMRKKANKKMMKNIPKKRLMSVTTTLEVRWPPAQVPDSSERRLRSF